MKVDFLNLKAQYLTIKDEIHEAIDQVIEKTAFAGGPFVEAFEKDFAAYCQTQQAIGVGNGTEALWLALLGFDIGAGDEVITVPNTFIATAEAISYCGATPVFVDVDPATYTMDPAKIEAAITKKTKAIIPVHLFGQTADMDPILAIAKKHNLIVIEDACQAHGAEYKGKRAGSLGHAGCFSFYPGKNLGAYGEAGAITLNDSEVAAKIRILRDHGQPKKYYHDVVGWNGRMDGIQGAILQVKLRHLEDWTEARRKHANHYKKALAGIDAMVLPKEADYARHVYHVFTLLVDNRDRMLDQLKERGIFCGIHYPVPVHQTGAYQFLNYPAGSFPVAEKNAGRLLSLPMFPELTEEQVEYTCQTLKELL